MAVNLPPITASTPTVTGSLTDAYSIWSVLNTEGPFDITTAPAAPIGPVQAPTPTAGPAGVTDSDMSIHARIGESGVLPYAVLFFIWSLVMAAGLTAIWLNREKKAIKIRDWRSITIAVIAIQLLFMACLIASWIPHKFNCQAVYWVVSLLIPACLAAFQIPNARLVSYYLANKNSGMSKKLPAKDHRLWRSWRKLSVIERTYFTVIVGLLFQFLFATLMYFGSRRFHAGYGLWGRPEDWQNCMYGPPWVVSVVWQFIWAYGTGIFLLRQIRHVKDIYHWALETRLAIIASMPGPLLFMIFILGNDPTIHAVNKQWPPRNWLIPGLAVVQGVLVVFPLWDVCMSDAEEKAHKLHNSTYGTGSSIDNMINVIGQHSEPLIDYAASTRFNAELVIFLRDVKKWRITWTSHGANWDVPSNPEERIACYKHAALIYYKLVHTRVAAFAINIDTKTRQTLASEFRYARYIGGGRPSFNRQDMVTPWASADALPAVASIRTSPLALKGLETTLAEAEACIVLISEETLHATENCVDDATAEGINMASHAQQDAPDTFSLMVFDEAYKEVKQEAYHNVWLPYFLTGRYRQDFRAFTDIA